MTEMSEPFEHQETANTDVNLVMNEYFDGILFDEPDDLLYASHKVRELRVPFSEIAAQHGAELATTFPEGQAKLAKIAECVKTGFAVVVYSSSEVNASRFLDMAAIAGKDEDWLALILKPNERNIDSVARFYGLPPDQIDRGVYRRMAYDAMRALGLNQYGRQTNSTENPREKFMIFGKALVEGMGRSMGFLGVPKHRE